MVKKALNYAIIPFLAVLFVFCIHNATFQARAITPLTLPTTIPTGIPTLKPIN
ncbi:MAG: hypothetical protein GX625_09670, partial [Clostridiaceae bacterium]|nr:hypothetical protein [Clostridiaceae bacterium]